MSTGHGHRKAAIEHSGHGGPRRGRPCTVREAGGPTRAMALSFRPFGSSLQGCAADAHS